MELNEIKSMWQAYDSKLEKSLQLNLHCIELIQAQKVRSELAPLLWKRGIELVLHAVVIVLLAGFLASHFTEWPYMVSAVLLLCFYIIAFSNCTRQIMIIRRMDYSNDIVTIQSSLVILRTHMVNFVRLAILCIPVFLAYPMVVSKAIADYDLKGLSFMDIRAGYQGNWWTVQLYASVILIPVCIWLYRQLSYKKIHTRWVRNTIQKFSGSRVTKAFEFINELESLKRDGV
jgi:hypothetical protein